MNKAFNLTNNSRFKKGAIIIIIIVLYATRHFIYPGRIVVERPMILCMCESPSETGREKIVSPTESSSSYVLLRDARWMGFPHTTSSHQSQSLSLSLSLSLALSGVSKIYRVAHRNQCSVKLIVLLSSV